MSLWHWGEFESQHTAKNKCCKFKDHTHTEMMELSNRCLVRPRQLLRTGMHSPCPLKLSGKPFEKQTKQKNPTNIAPPNHICMFRTDYLFNQDNVHILSSFFQELYFSPNRNLLVALKLNIYTDAENSSLNRSFTNAFTKLWSLLNTYHFLWCKGVDPLLNEGLRVVLRVMLPILLLFETDQSGGIALLPLGQLLLWVGWGALCTVPTQTLL